MSDQPRTIVRRIPARTETLTVLWCSPKFSTFDQSWRAVRAQMSNPLDTCYWCERKFNDGEIIGIASFKGKGNKVLCTGCADKIEGADKDLT